MEKRIELMDQLELFATIENTLNIHKINSPSESWGETADRIESELPMIAKILRRAESKWMEFQN